MRPLDQVYLSLLRGVCQMPAYVACERGYFREQGIDIQLAMEATAWLVPERLLRGEVQFAVMPWTRVVTASAQGEPLVLVCGSGCEEAAIVVRRELRIDEVRKVAIPQPGGMKDLTAAGLMSRLGWEGVETIRLPSGDGAILALVGGGADAAAMVEPYATMLEQLRIGTVVRRTGDLWPGAPGCSLTTTVDLIGRQPDLVQRMVTAFVRGARFIDADPDQSAEIAARYIGVSSPIIRAALWHNSPNVQALHHEEIMDDVVTFMQDMGYLACRPSRAYRNLSFLERVPAGPPLEGVDRPLERERSVRSPTPR